MLEFIDVSKDFGKRTILYAISFTLPDHGLVGLFGRSGSGKTTILKMIKRFEKPTSGIIECSVSNQDIVFLNQSIDDFDTITLDFYFKMLGLEHKQDEIHDLLKKFLLPSQMGQKINTLSNGEKKRLQLLIALVLKPKILLLDEPFSGLDEETIQLIIPSLIELSKSILVIVSTHQEKETLPFDIVLEVKRKKVTCTKKEVSTPIKEKSNSGVTPKGFKTFFFYLWKKSMNITQIIYLSLLAIFYSVGLLGTSLDHFDRYSAAIHYYQDVNLPISLKRSDYNSASKEKLLLEYEEIKNCPFSIVSIFQPQDESEVDCIGIASKELEEDEVIITSNLKEQNSKKFLWKEKEYRIRSSFDFADVKMVVFSKNYTQEIEKTIYVKDTQEMVYQIQINDSLMGKQVIVPHIIESNRLYHVDTNEYYQLSDSDVKVEESNENIIYVSNEQYENFFFDFKAQGNLFVNRKEVKKFINYMRHSVLDFADEETVRLLNQLEKVHYGKTSISYGIIMLSSIAIVLLSFASVKNIDQQIVEREYQYLAFKGYQKRMEAIHLSIHIFYLAFSFILSNLLRYIIFLFRGKNQVIQTISYITSPFAIRRILIVFIGAAVVSFLYFYLKKRIKGYSYLNSLKKEE